jgi:hypothetical protein
MWCWHCLQSRENISVGQGEGFAHVFATWLFNAKNTNAKFVYCKSVMDWEGDIPIVHDPPHAVTATANVTWMEDECNNVVEDNGTEWDWINFFTNVYATKDTGAPDSVRYSMGEINAVWAAGGFKNVWGQPDVEPMWDNVLGEVEDLYGFETAKYNQFIHRGDDSGVNH